MSNRSFIPVVGLVGGIGSGKSALAREFGSRHPVVIIDGDRVGHQLLKDAAVKNRLRERFGESVFDEQGEVIRSALARLVFGSTADHRQARTDLERIVHPHIRKVFCERIAEVRQARNVEAVLLDAAVLLEAGWKDGCDAVVFVDTPRPVRLERVATNRGWDEQELNKRESSQLNLDAKREASDYRINNAGPLSDAVAQLETIVEQVIHDRRRRPC